MQLRKYCELRLNSFSRLIHIKMRLTKEQMKKIRRQDIKSAIDELSVLLLEEKDKKKYDIFERIKLILANELDYL